jgi:hypothetical protein
LCVEFPVSFFLPCLPPTLPDKKNLSRIFFQKRQHRRWKAAPTGEAVKPLNLSNPEPVQRRIDILPEDE